jgi:outer membrane protein insertion porin family
MPHPSHGIHMPQLEANPELRGVVSSGANVLPQAVIEEAFADQYGKTLNFRNFRGALAKLNSWCAPCAAG